MTVAEDDEMCRGLGAILNQAEAVVCQPRHPSRQNTASCGVHSLGPQCTAPWQRIVRFVETPCGAQILPHQLNQLTRGEEGRSAFWVHCRHLRSRTSARTETTASTSVGIRDAVTSGHLTPGACGVPADLSSGLGFAVSE